MRHLNNGTDHRHSKSCCDQSSPARRTMTGRAYYIRGPRLPGYFISMCDTTSGKMATEQPPFQYHLDFRVSHQGDIDGQCKELLFRLRPEWKERELKNKVSAWHLFTVCLKKTPSRNRLLHSPSLVVIGLSVGYETQLPIGWHHPFVVGWSNCLEPHCITCPRDQWELPCR